MDAGQIKVLCRLELPYPPSANKYWRRVGNRFIRSREADRYKEIVREHLIAEGLTKPVESMSICIKVEAYPPDKRCRDADNIMKVLVDSMRGFIYVDDDQIEIIIVHKREPLRPNGLAYIEVLDGENYEITVLSGRSD